MLRRPGVLAVALALVAFGLSALDSGDPPPSAPLRGAVDAVLGPPERALAAGVGAVGSLGDLADREQMRRLREENERLRRELAAAGVDRRLARELDAVRTAAGDLQVLPARVTAAGRALGFARTVTLDVGEDDGVRAGQAVLAGTGLAGRTVRVTGSSAVVLLATDPTFAAGSRLSTTGALGLASGTGDALRWLQVEPGPVEPGAMLLTSGSGTFPADLPVGRVTEVGETAGGLATTAVVEPLVAFGTLDVVGVVVG